MIVFLLGNSIIEGFDLRKITIVFDESELVSSKLKVRDEISIVRREMISK